jgi:hypothetical protein
MRSGEAAGRASAGWIIDGNLGLGLGPFGVRRFGPMASCIRALSRLAPRITRSTTGLIKCRNGGHMGADSAYSRH